MAEDKGEGIPNTIHEAPQPSRGGTTVPIIGETTYTIDGVTKKADIIPKIPPKENLHIPQKPNNN